ncbi:MAG: beta-aspartyl-peptidase [Bacillota bacterium]
MIKILKNAIIYAPEPLGRKDILILGERIGYIADDIPEPSGLGDVEVCDLKGHTLVPGFIDQHVHLTGGGGEGGPATRTPEAMLSDITTAGVTTVVGCLGTDGTTRSMQALLAKARALEIEGITTWIYTGAYEVPTRTLTDNARNDLILIEKVIGIGEIAISDHRSAQPQTHELMRLAAEARVGGMLGNKPGILHLHVGSGPRGLKPVFDIIEETEIPITQFTPTHLNRTARLFEEAVEFGRHGGKIDFTAGGSAAKAVVEAIARGVPEELVTISSDGNGSLPRFDESGRLSGLGVGSLKTLHETLVTVVREEGLPLERALKIITANVATTLNQSGRKGCLRVGADADLLLLGSELEIIDVWARGRKMVEGGKAIVLGTFEQP